MATRLLLTLLALLAGLAAQLSPAQARGAGVSEVTVEIGQFEVGLMPSRREARPRAMVRGGDPDGCAILMLKRVENCAPAVMLRADRARE